MTHRGSGRGPHNGGVYATAGGAIWVPTITATTATARSVAEEALAE